MRSLSLFALVAALAYASISSQEELRGRHWHHKHMPAYEQVNDNDYELNKEYLYEYNGQLMTGIPQTSEQHSATRMQALVKIIFKTQQKAVLKIEKVRFGYFNDKVAQPKYVHDFDLFEQVSIDEDKKELLLQPIEFAYEQGLVTDVYFTEQEQPWSANIKRAVLNLLQVNVNKQRRIDTHENLRYKQTPQTSESIESAEWTDKQIGEFKDFFTVMENTMEGECETAYTMLKTGEQQVNVTKTINFENCPRRPDIRYNHRFQNVCPTCQGTFQNKERNLQSSTVVRQQVKLGGNSQPLFVEKAETESMYTFAPFTPEGSLVQTYVLTQLRLVKKQEVQERELVRREFTRKSDSGLIYTPEFDLIKEDFFREGDSDLFAKTWDETFSQIDNKVEFVKSILQKLVHYMRDNVEEEAPRQFVRLVKIMRTMDKKDVERLHELYIENEQEQDFTREEMIKIKSILIDALAVSGTRVTVEHLVNQIEQQRIPTLKASLAIRKLQSVRVISEPIIEKIWQLTNEKVCRENPIGVCQAAYLTVGSLLNGMCETTFDKLAHQYKHQQNKLCTRQTKQQWTEKLIRRFEECDTDVCRITVLKAIANAGLDQSINQIQKIVVNRRYSPLIRTEAILAVRQLVDIMPRKVEKVLLPIYMNQREQPVVRMAAFHKIMATQPEKFILDQITRSLYNENNKQVAAFVYTSLNEYANSTNVCEKRMAADLKLSLRHARNLPVWQWASKSRFMRQQLYGENGERGVSFDINTLLSNHSMLPMDVAASMQWNLANMWQANAVTVGFAQQNIEQFIRRLAGKYSHKMQNVFDWTSSSEETSPKFRKTLDNLFEDLSIEERDSMNTEEQSLAYLYMRLMNQDYAFLPISKELLPEMLVDILSSEQLSLTKLVKRAAHLLKSDKLTMPFDVQTSQIYHESTRKIATTMGVPIVLSSKSPIVSQVRGELKIKFDNVNKKVELECLDCKPSVMISMIDRVETWSPIVNTGVKVIFQSKIYAPVTAKLEAHLFNGEQPQLRLVIKPVDKKYELLRMQTRPSTTVLVWPRKLEQWQEPMEKTIHGEQATRLTEGEHKFGEKEIGIKFHTKYSWHRCPAHSVAGYPMAPMAGPNYFVVRVEPGVSMPREIEFVLTGTLFDKMTKGGMKPEFDNFYEQSDEMLRDQSYEESQQKSYERYYKNYETEQPTRHMVKLTVEGKGGQIERRAQLTVDCTLESESQRAGKCVAIVKRTPIPEVESEEWQLKKTVEFLYPKAVQSVEQLEQDKNKLMIRVKTQWGQISEQDKHIDIKIIGEQSRQMFEQIEQSIYRKHSKLGERRSLFSPVAQSEHIERLSVLDQFKADVDYENVPAFVKNQTEKILDMLKAYYYMQTDIDHQPQQSERYNNINKGQLRVQINVDPISLQTVNMTIEMPREKVLIKDVPLKYPITVLQQRRLSKPSKSFYEMISNTVSNYDDNTCKVRDERVETFAEIKYPAPLSTCYSLIAKDCTRKSKFAVLVKKISEQSEKKQIKIISEDVELIVMPKQQGGEYELEYMLNGEKKNMRQLQQVLEHERHEILSVSEEENGYTRISLPEAGIRVYFDGYAVNVKTSNYFGGRLCGLCGQLEPEHYEQECELRDADNECVNVNEKKELKRLFKSYVQDKSECTDEQQKYYSSEDKYEFEPLQWEEREFDSIEQQWTESEYTREVQPRQETRVIEQLHEVCFSKKPVLRCPKNTQTTERQNGHIKVVYTCLDRNNFETDEYLRQARQGRVVVDVQELPASFTQSEKVPKVCEKIQY